jgi:hypothetical protein
MAHVIHDITICMTEPTAVPDTPAAITTTSVLAFFAADHAAVAPDGKIYVNGGGIALLRFPTFPANLPTLGIAAILELPFHDTMRDHTIRVGMVGPNDQELPVRVEAQFRTALVPDAQFGESGLVPFAVTVSNLEFPAPGRYTLVLWFDNIEKKRYWLRAIQTPGAASAGGSPSALDA